MTAIIQHVFDHHVVDRRSADGYLNATAACKAAGKLWGHYWENSTTQEFAEALAIDIGIPISELYQSVRGGKSELQGTFIHPYAAVHLGQWLSPQFAVAVAKWTHEWMSGRLHPQIPTLAEIDGNLRSFVRYEKRFGWDVARAIMLPRIPLIPEHPPARPEKPAKLMLRPPAQSRSSIEDFIDQRLVASAGARTKAADIHAAYEAWCAAAGVQPVTTTMRGRRIAARFGSSIKQGGLQIYRDVAMIPPN